MTTMNDPTTIREFTTAGRALLTLQSAKTGNRYTYQVTRAKDVGDRFFVSLLSGPNNTSDYVYIGTMDGTAFRTTKKSALTNDAQPVAAFRFLCERVLTNAAPPASLGLEVRHEGRCGRCKRTLTVPESIDRGIGPECMDKMFGN